MSLRTGGARLRAASWLALALSPGSALAQTPPASCPDGLEVLLERPFATERELTPGDDVVIRAAPDAAPCRGRVAGIFEPPPDPSRLTVARPRVLFHVPQLAELTDRRDEVDQFTIRVAPGADPAAVARRLEPLLPGTQVLSTAEVAARSSTTFTVVSRFHRAIGVITLVAGGVFLACIMILKVQERRAPIAAARLLGVPRGLLLGWTVAEAAVVSTLGGVLGLGLGVAASRIINLYYQRVYDTRLVFSHITSEMIVQTLALAVVLGMTAGVYAGIRLFADDPLAEVGR
ncbi:MAG: FtsX-like permease family protein [Gemmatimonadetes bacterium]|nr:FtsX-like permease family protein [Gemmatimonadota bacterium]